MMIVTRKSSSSVRPLSRKLNTTLLFLAIVMLPNIAMAKRSIHYVPPPYITRFLCSLFTLALVAALLAAPSYFSIRLFDPVYCRRKRNLFILIVFIILILATILVSFDALNDELWSPWLTGSPIISLIIPLALLTLTNKFKLWLRLIISVVSIVPSVILSGFIAYYWQFFGLHLGLPTTW